MPTNIQITRVASELPEALNQARTKDSPVVTYIDSENPPSPRESIEFVVYEFSKQQDAGEFGNHYALGRVFNTEITNMKAMEKMHAAKQEGKFIIFLKPDFVVEEAATIARSRSMTAPTTGIKLSPDAKPANSATAASAVATATASSEPPKAEFVPPRITIPTTKKPYKLTEEEANTLIQGKLIPLTTKYLIYLQNTAKGLKGKEKEAIDHKIDLVKTLQKSVVGDNVTNLYRVTNFYKTLNECCESGMTAHRDPKWKRYVKDAVMALGIAIGSIVVGLGLTALAAYVKTGDTETKSMKFWQSGGRNVVEKLKGMEPDTDKSGPGPSGG